MISKNHDTLDIARSLGFSLINSQEFKNFKNAEDALNNDKEARELLNLYDSIQISLKQMIIKKSDPKEIEKKQNKLSQIKSIIEKNIIINDFNKAKEKYNSLLKNIENILNYITGDNWKQSKGNCGGCKKG